jgi:hypothetical protein
MSDDLIIDLSNYKDRMGSRIEPGHYRVQVEDAEAGQSAQKKTPQVQVWFRVLGTDFDGQTVVDRLYLTDASMFRMVGFMQAVGLPTPRKKLKVNVRQFVGKILEIDVEDGEPYNGRVRSEVRGYSRALGASTGAAASTDEFAGLDEFSAPTAEPDTSNQVSDLPEPEPQAAAPAEQVQASTAADTIEIDNAAAVAEDGSVDLENLSL